MADENKNKTNWGMPNEFTLDDNWKNIGTTVGTNGLIGAGVGFLVSLVLMRRRRSILIGFSSGIGVGIGWRDSHATSQFLQFSNANLSPSQWNSSAIPTIKDRFWKMTSKFTNSDDKSTEKNE
eukprot:826026_1